MILDALNVIGTIDISNEANWLALELSVSDRDGGLDDQEPDSQPVAMQANLSRLLDQLETETRSFRDRLDRARVRSDLVVGFGRQI